MPSRVSSVPNILVFTSTWFIKEPESAAIAAWHQDATYFGLLPHLHVTAWVALTDATAENGCMEFLPGSHERGQLPHTAGVVASSVNRARQAVDGSVDDAPAVHAPLRAGEFSLHHTLTLHRSQPNRSRGRRIGPRDQLHPDARAAREREGEGARDARERRRCLRPLRSRARAVAAIWTTRRRRPSRAPTKAIGRVRRTGLDLTVLPECAQHVEPESSTSTRSCSTACSPRLRLMPSSFIRWHRPPMRRWPTW
jgi:ectoine hydroxylase-related dioxygenase (phytanoyl-CoA dioxygenase family)